MAGRAALCSCRPVDLTGQLTDSSPHHSPLSGDNRASESSGWLASQEPASSYQRAFTGNARPAWEGGRAVCPTLGRHFRLIPKSASWRLGWPGLNFIRAWCGFLSCCRLLILSFLLPPKAKFPNHCTMKCHFSSFHPSKTPGSVASG